MLLTSQENGVDPGLKINLDSQSLSLNSELSEPFPLSSPPSGSSSTPLPPERLARQWLQQLGTTDRGTIADMTVDFAGNIYLVGSTNGYWSGYTTDQLFRDWDTEREDSDAWLAKFDSSGQLLWADQIRTPHSDVGSRIAVDNAGNVYVAGSTNGLLGIGVDQNTPGSPDAWLAQYSPNGYRLWTQQKQFDSWDSVSNLEVDAFGVYMTGGSYAGRSVGSRNIAWAARYSGNGELTWSERYSLNFLGDIKNILSRGLALDNANNLYVALDVGRWMNKGQPRGGNPHPYWNNGVRRSGIQQDGTGTLVSKYNAFGGLIWQKYLDFSMDRNTARGDFITSDDSGNFYLGSDRGLAKYDSNGSQIWQQDFATSQIWQQDFASYQTTMNITTDAEGNIYLSGSNAYEARTIAYDSEGNLLWETEFGTPTDDLASAIAIDTDGQVYLAGSTRWALDSAHANKTDLWLAKYWQLPDDPNQAPQSLRFSLDRQYKATDTLAVKNGWVQDLDGAIEIARVDLELMDANGTAISSSNITDFSLAAWNPDWAAFESNWDLSALNLNDGTYRLRAIAYDAAGAASSAFERQFLIYSNSAPERLQFSLTSNQYEANQTLTVKNAWVYDENGGKDIASIDFELIDTMGNAIDLENATQFNLATWSHQWANFDYSVDLGQLALNPGIYTLRGTAYDLAGAQSASFERQFQLNLPTNAAFAWVQDIDNRGVDIAIDNAGNLYVTGSAFNTITQGSNNLTQHDIWIAKYNSNGDLLWQEDWGTTQSDLPEGITVDRSGNVYLTGYTAGALSGTNAGEMDAWLIKYSSNGDLSWIEQLGTASHDFAVDAAVDDLGNIYITGSTEGNLGGVKVGIRDPWVAKYNSDGSLLWVEQWGRSGFNVPTGTAVDSAGNVYITGYGGGDAWLAKFNDSGDLIWTRELGTGYAEDSGGIAIDRGGNIYLTGFTSGSLGGTNQGESDIWLAKYDSHGNSLWTRQVGTDSYDSSQGVAVDDWGNIYVGGYTRSSLAGTSAGSNDAWVGKYDSMGNLTWQQQWGTTDTEFSWGIAVDGSNIYLVGQTGTGGSNPTNYWILKYA